MKTRGKVGIFLAVVGILASLAFIGTNQTTQINQEIEKIPINVSPQIQNQPTKSEVRAEPKTEIASFVDPKKDPQSYVDRYNTEPIYKKWFDENYPEYSSIYEAVGLKATKTEVKIEPVQTEPVQTEPVQTEPVQTEPVQTEPVQTKPVEAESIFGCSGNAECITGMITKIVDGDTIDIDGIRIRISLTNTPERDDEGFSEATQFTTSLCPVGSKAHVDQDDLQPYDKFGRMLGKVTCSDKVLNSELLYNNFATISTEFCSTSEFTSESWAQKYGCSPQINKSTTTKSITPSIPEKDCDQSYPDVCINPSPPDLDCKDIPYTNFKVLQPDPHRFDGDHDGMGCEKSTSSTPTTSSSETNCDPSYPDVCISSPPPDLDCKDVPYKKFRVLQPDPHRFDGDKDGIGCES